jgi:hypothetical protein
MLDTERLSLKILRADKVALRRLAEVEGEAMSVIVRRILRDEFKRRGLWPPKTADVHGRSQHEMGVEHAQVVG